MLRGRDLVDDMVACEPPDGSMAFWWLGQHSFVIKLAGRTAYIDPYLKQDDRRQVKPLLAPEDVTNADLVLCTHDHGDHIDPTAVPGIAGASPGARFVVSRRHERRLLGLGVPEDRLVLMDPDGAWEWEEIRVTALRARHEFFENNEHGWPYLGFVVEAPGVAAYHAGDTLVYDGLLSFLQRWDLTAMFLPINGRDAERYRRNILGNMTYQEAADLAGDLRPEVVVPAHYEMFAHNAEDVGKFLAYLHVKFPGQRAWAGRHGERFDVGGR